MIIECPECGTKNSTLKPPERGRKYRCGQCGAVITFLQAADAEDDTPYVPPTANKLSVARVERSTARAAENTSDQRTLPVVPKEIVEYRGKGREISHSRKNQKLIKEWIIHAGLPSTSMKQRGKFVNVPAGKRETRQGLRILYILLGLFITILVVGLVFFFTQYY